MKILVNGSFDVLHLGHLKLLEHARSYKDSTVLVLTDSDRRIRELKGSNRPVNSQHERVEFLKALKYVDQVEVFDSDHELETLIKQFQPDVMVKGSDYQGKEIIGKQHCKDIYFYERLVDYSTTKKIQDIANRR
jgi:D-beta-D-heptose 7-phosphate kinase/D-beta-D-heptose 1-phosphate adenosyltransferase